MANSNRTTFIDKTIANLWRAWDELSSSTVKYISGKPRPDLPQDDLDKVMVEVNNCIKGKSDEGHSTWQEGVKLCDAASVNKLIIFHHDPGNDDSAMDIISKNVGKARPGSLVAMEGMELEV